MKAPYDEIWHQCPVCEGLGTIYTTFNIKTRTTKEVSEYDYSLLPDEEDEAEERGEEWVKESEEICPHCDGMGRVEEDSDVWQNYLWELQN